MSDHDGRRLVLGAHQRQRALLAEVAPPHVPDPVRIGVLERPLRQFGEQALDPVTDPAEHRVRERDRPLEPGAPHELDGLVHGGVARHAAEEAELVGAQAQRRQHGRVELAHRPLAERLDRVVERPHALHGAECELPRKRAVALVEALGGGSQRPVGVRVLLEDAADDLVRRGARRCYLSPRSHASYGIRLPPSGLHLDRDELAVLEPRLPDRHAPAVQLAARADVRRERPDPVQALLRPREVELAVGRLDLGRVGRLALLRREGRCRQHLVEQRGRELGRARVDRAGVVLRRERKRPLRRNRPRVELLHRLVDRHARLRVARQERPLDRRGAAPARQQRGMHVQPEPLARAGSPGSAGRRRRRRPRRREARARPSAAPAAAPGSRAAPRRPSPAAPPACRPRPARGCRAGSAAPRRRGARPGARARRRRTAPWRRRRSSPSQAMPSNSLLLAGTGDGAVTP